MRISLLFCRIGEKGGGSFNHLKILLKLPKKTLGFYLGIMSLKWVSFRSAATLDTLGWVAVPQIKTNVAFFWSCAKRKLSQRSCKKQHHIDTMLASLPAHWNGDVWLFQHLWKDIEKSMSCSMVTLYYFEPQKKHLKSLLSAWFKTPKMVGDASFELATPAVWRLLHFAYFCL